MPASNRGLAPLQPRAGRSHVDPAPEPEPEPEPAPAAERKPATTATPGGKPIRQTLDLPPEQYHAVQDAARDLARGLGANSREVNAQTVLRALVARMLTDPDLMSAVRQDVSNSVRQ